MDLSGWFSLSVVPLSYVVGVVCSNFVLFCDLTGILKGLLERVCSQTQLSQLRCFNDYTRQLHVSAPPGHLQVAFKRT